MKLRWPISPFEESLVSSLLRSLVPPRRPATQASLSFSLLSSNNRAMLSCGMGLPVGDDLVQFCGRAHAHKTLAQRFVAEHLRELGKDLQVQIAGAVRHEQHEYQADVLPVRCIERYRLLHPHEGT